jgi:hypothetical protein
MTGIGLEWYVETNYIGPGKEVVERIAVMNVSLDAGGAIFIVGADGNIETL